MAQVRKFDFATDPNGTFKALIDYVRVRVTKRKLSFRLTRAGRTIVIPVLPPTGGSEDFFDVDLADGDDYCTRVRFEESSVYFTGFGRQFPGFFFWLFFSDFEHLFPNIPKPQQRSRPLGFKGRYGHELLVYGAFMGMGPLKTAIRILSRATNDRATFNKLKPHLATIAFMIGESARSNDIFLRFLSAEEDELVQCTDWMWSMVHCWGDCSYDLECNYMNESQQVRDQKCLLGAAGIEVDEEKAIDKNDMRDLMIQNTALLKDQESKILKLFGSKGIPVVTGMPKAQPSGRVLGGSGGEKRLRDGGRKAQPGPPSGGVGTRKHKELLNSILWNEVDAQVSRKRQKLEPRSSELIQNKDIEMTPVNDAATKKAVDSGIKNRQCSAFIELKGRQCVRWANDGDIYCCVHLASRFTGSSTKAEARPPLPGPMCEGTTVLGTQCKHRSLPGSSFCKMHRVRTDAQTISNSTENTLKRKYDEIITSSETANCKDMVLMGEVGSPLHMDRVSVGEACQDRVHLAKKLKLSSQGYCGPEILHSIGSNPHDNGVSCCDSPKRYSLYCDKHIPSWLKRARNGKSRIISKEIFLDLLKECCSLEQKLHLHQACELFYKLFKSILSLRNPVPMEVQLQWAMSEASKNFCIGEFLLRLVSTEKERLKKLWGFGSDGEARVPSSVIEESPSLPSAVDGSYDDDKSIRCKICSKEFPTDEELGNHWMDNHKKEAQWHFRGHACAICLDSFTNKKGLETHVQERHHVQFVEQCMLLQCIPCHSHFGNSEQLWSHVLAVHSAEFRLSKSAEQLNKPVDEEKTHPVKELELGNAGSVENNVESLAAIRKYVCRFCGLKFDLLPDLGRHHQAAHMGPNTFSSRPPKRGIRYYAYKLKSGRLSRPRLKKGLGAAAAYRMRNATGASMKKRIQASKSLNIGELSVQSVTSETGTLGRLAESQCSSVANILFSEIQKTKSRPNNQDILAVARSACCRVSLKASLEGRYGVLPERLYLKAAKLCSEHNIQVEWHQEGFICSRGCKSFKDPGLLMPLLPPTNGLIGKRVEHSSDQLNDWEVDECHYIIDLHHFREGPNQKATVLCTDISVGKETLPVACVVDENLLDSIHVLQDGSDCHMTRLPMPWESFEYITRPMFDQLHSPEIESLQLGCSCSHSICDPEICDHVYLFDNDYEDAKDIYGKSMVSRFAYDDKGRIVLEEGYLVYECNRMCGCSKSCPNRVLQNGLRVKLEVFKTEKKGWAVRASEPILRGTFVCEYIGEVLDEQEAEKRRERYGLEGCSYMYNIDAHTNDMSRLMEGQGGFVIDATKYGNVSRFINHSCSPNLVNHQVLVDSIDSLRAHIGLYASQDIASGEELTYNYRYGLLPGEGYPCLCGAPTCRGRLY